MSEHAEQLRIMVGGCACSMCKTGRALIAENERLSAALLRAYQFISPLSDPMPITPGEMAREIMNTLNIHQPIESGP